MDSDNVREFLKILIPLSASVCLFAFCIERVLNDKRKWEYDDWIGWGGGIVTAITFLTISLIQLLIGP